MHVTIDHGKVSNESEALDWKHTGRDVILVSDVISVDV